MSSGDIYRVLMDIYRLVVKRRRRGGKALEGEREERERILTLGFLLETSYTLSLPHQHQYLC